MKKFLLCLPIALVMLFSLVGCDVEEMSSLPEFSRPYSGEYVCKELVLGGEDYTDRYRIMRLKLGSDGKFLFFYESKDGSEERFDGQYTVDLEEGEITFYTHLAGRCVSRKFPMEKGEIIVSFPLAGKLLLARFTTP